jgi:RNA polymerase sigma-70 factor (ECF subfamily)
MPDVSALIQRWQAGDERAAQALYYQYRDSVFRLAYGLLGNPADAEEAAQDALTYALVNIKRYDPGRASFATWLHTITVSRCRDRQRRRRLPGLSLTAWLRQGRDVGDPAPRPEHCAIQAEAHSRIWDAVQALNRPQREAVLLRYWAGHTYREIAETLGCPVRTAQSRLRLAYKQLRASLAPADLVDVREEQVR